jgi:hypothetical protein
MVPVRWPTLDAGGYASGAAIETAAMGVTLAGRSRRDARSKVNVMVALTLLVLAVLAFTFLQQGAG